MKSAIWISSVQNVSPLVRAILLLRNPAQVITSFARAIELECRPICKCICALVFHKMRVDSCFRSDAEAFWRRLLCSESGRYEWACFYGLWGPRHPPHWLREGTFCASVYLLFDASTHMLNKNSFRPVNVTFYWINIAHIPELWYFEGESFYSIGEYGMLPVI